MAPHFNPSSHGGCYAVVQKRHVMTDDEVTSLYGTGETVFNLKENQKKQRELPSNL